MNRPFDKESIIPRMSALSAARVGAWVESLLAPFTLKGKK